MKKFLIAVAILSACKKNFGEGFLSEGEATARATEIFGMQAFCKGENRSLSSGDGHSGWTCFEVDHEEHGTVIYRPQPIVVCIDRDCHRVGPKQTTMETR